MSDREPPPWKPSFYASIYPQIKSVAHAHGYALALHWSLARDLDVVAVAWTWNASGPFVLVDDVIDRLGAWLVRDPIDLSVITPRHPSRLRRAA